MSPTQRSLRECRSRGWIVDVAERWQPPGIRKDLFGIIDLVACTPGGVLGLQATSAGNMGARVAKLLAAPETAAWLASGGLLEVWGWEVDPDKMLPAELHVSRFEACGGGMRSGSRDTNRA